MKIKTSKVVIEEMEFDSPEYFSHDGYFYMNRPDGFTKVYNGLTFCHITTSDDMSFNADKEIVPITRAEFFVEFNKAVETMTGFKYTPEISQEEAVLNNFSQAHRGIERDELAQHN
jgi:hypothetical protein